MRLFAAKAAFSQLYQGGARSAACCTLPDCPHTTSSFQVQSQNDAPIDYEKMLEVMTQARLARDYEIDMMVQFLRSHRSANSDIANHSVRADEPLFWTTRFYFSTII